MKTAVMDAEESQNPVKIKIIGGGITGLSAAHRLVELSREAKFHVELTLIEASDRLGGAFGTEKIGDFTIETGADSFITNKPWGVNLCRRLGIEDRLISPNIEFQRSLILHRGRTVPTPIGFNLLAPSRIWPMVTTPLLSPLGKMRMAAELFVSRRKEAGDESLASFVRRRFGQEMLDRIVQPMVGGIYTSDPEQLSLSATLPRFVDLEKEYGSLILGLRKKAAAEKGDKEQGAPEKGTQSASGARYGLFATPRGGMSELLDRLEEAIAEDVSVQRNQPVSGIAQRDEDLQVTFCSGESVDCDRILLAMPSYRAGELLRPLHSELSQQLEQIEYASSAILVSGHRLADISHPLDAFGLVIPHVEGRKILAVSFLSRKFPERAPEGSAILRTFVGGAMQPEEVEKSDEEVISTVLSELNQILGVKGAPIFTKLVRYQRAMPQFTVGHQERVGQISRLAEELPHVYLAGNAYDGVGVPDCIHSGEQAAESLWQSIVKS